MAGISLIDGIWNHVRFNYEAKWKELSKEEQNVVVYVYRKFRNVYRTLEHFSTGDFSDRSNVEATARAACEHLNSFIGNPKQQVDYTLQKSP